MGKSHNRLSAMWDDLAADLLLIHLLINEYMGDVEDCF